MVIIGVVLLVFIGLVVITRPRGGTTRRGSGFLDGGIPNDGSRSSPHHHTHHHHHHDGGGGWGGHHGGFDGGGGGHH